MFSANGRPASPPPPPPRYFRLHSTCKVNYWCIEFQNMITFQWNFQIRTTTFVYHVLASWVFHFRCPKIPNTIFIPSKWAISGFSVFYILKILGNASLKIHESLEGAPHYPVSLKLFWKVSLKSYISLNKYPHNPGTSVSLKFHSKLSKLSPSL